MIHLHDTNLGYQHPQTFSLKRRVINARLGDSCSQLFGHLDVAGWFPRHVLKKLYKSFPSSLQATFVIDEVKQIIQDVRITT